MGLALANGGLRSLSEYADSFIASRERVVRGGEADGGVGVDEEMGKEGAAAAGGEMRAPPSPGSAGIAMVSERVGELPRFRENEREVAREKWLKNGRAG